MGDRSDEIGSRWEETLKRINAVWVVEHMLEHKDRQFLQSLRDRLMQFKSRAFVNAKMLNWLSDIERSHLEKHR